MNLVDHIEAVKAQLAVCDDIEEATRIYADCRRAEADLQQLTSIAADVADKLSLRTYAAPRLQLVKG